MSRLPRAASATVEAPKVRDYLLNPGNPQNGGKVAHFGRYGFRREEWPVLSSALRDHPVANEIIATTITVHGTKYVVRCTLVTPDGRNPCMTTVWIMEPGIEAPRLVTAY